MKNWNNDEIKNLFICVENQKKIGKSALDAFLLHATKYNRRQNSVRNFYYNQVKNMDNETAKNMGFDLSNHKINKINNFTSEEIQKSIEQINNLKAIGYSTRKACLKLADGNITKMLRLQNKYISINKSSTQIPKSQNIIQMPKRKSMLSDNDINTLFLGLVKIVKKNAMEQANIKLKNDIEYANDNLRKTLVDLSQKENEIKIMRTKINIIEKEKTNFEKQLNVLKCKTASLLSNEKLKKLETFYQTMKKQKATK